MKALLGIVGGFMVSMGMFALGLGMAVYFLAVEPVRAPGPSVDAAQLWPSEPRSVDAQDQDLQRVGAAPAAPDPNAGAGGADGQSGRPGTGAEIAAAPGPGSAAPVAVDTIATGALPEVEAGEPEAPVMSEAHLDWCAGRYRSYRPRDNSYTPYGGGRRTCVSPYSDDITAAAETLSPPPAEDDAYAEEGEGAFLEAETISDAGAYAAVPEEHIDYCFSRYRSYRPEDNSYQPYGGGPRRQCE